MMQTEPSHASPVALQALSSMATRQLLSALLQQYAAQGRGQVTLLSIGGVDAVQKVQTGAAFDIVVLAREAIDKLAAAGHLDPQSKTDLADSGVAVAVRAGAPRPDIRTAEAVRQAVLAAKNISYSTGPSGVALTRLFDTWGISAQLQGRIVQAPPGVPVGTLVARGEAELGFQQRSELIHLDGITVLGDLPDAIQITTTFAAAVMAASQHKAAALQVLQFLASDMATAAKREQGMAPCVPGAGLTH